MYQVTKSFAFSAAHSLPSLPSTHKCHRLHGHNYVVEICVSASELDRHGMVVDFAEISAAVDPIVHALDHRNLNDLFSFATTSENLAGYFLRECKKKIATGRAKVEWVGVSETPKTKAIAR